MRARGMTPGSVVLGQAVKPAGEVVARHLALVPGSPVVHLEGVRVADADQWASVVRLSGDEAALLQVAADQPALLFQRVTRDPGGAPVEYVRSLYRGDRYEVHTRLERIGG